MTNRAANIPRDVGSFMSPSTASAPSVAMPAMLSPSDLQQGQSGWVCSAGSCATATAVAINGDTAVFANATACTTTCQNVGGGGTVIPTPQYPPRPTRWPTCPRNRDIVWYRSQCFPVNSRIGISEVFEIPEGENVNFPCGAGSGREREYEAVLAIDTCNYGGSRYNFNSLQGCGQCISQSLPWNTVRNGISRELRQYLWNNGYVFKKRNRNEYRVGGFICTYEPESPFRALCAFDPYRKETPDISGRRSYL